VRAREEDDERKNDTQEYSNTSQYQSVVEIVQARAIPSGTDEENVA
jgi:hypothetical protein